MLENDKSFIGTGWSFPPTFDRELNSKVRMVSAEEDVKESLEILLQTTVGERVMLPSYGSNLTPYLFESITTSSLYFIKDLVRTAIIKYEPRVVLKQVIINDEEYLDGIIKIEIDYHLIKTNTRFNLVYPYYIEEGSGIPSLFHKQVKKIKSLKSK